MKDVIYKYKYISLLSIFFTMYAMRLDISIKPPINIINAAE